MLMLEQRGLDWLKLESYAKFPAGGEIHCPRQDCLLTFLDRKLWNDHLKDSEHRPGYGYRNEKTIEACAWRGTPGKELEALEVR